MSYLRVQNLTKTWGSTIVVDRINFELEKNQFIALLGPSGCGKSTTLNMIAGLEPPTSGVICLDNHDITKLSPGKRGISMVFQSYALFPHLSVAENIVFGLKAKKIPKPERITRLCEALELVGLAAVADKKPAQLSGGQRQRVALARAIVSQAPLCLMDEPLSNLDAKLRQSMRSEIRALQKKLGLSVLYVTHDQVEAMSMADSIILLNDGRIQQHGAPHELYQNPDTLFVAEFIGNPPMNILNTCDDTIVLGIRPEHVSLCSVKEPYRYAASVVNSDYHGADTLLTVMIGEQKLKLSLTGHYNYSHGELVHVMWNREDERYFSKSSGKRCSVQQRIQL